MCREFEEYTIEYILKFVKIDVILIDSYRFF